MKTFLVSLLLFLSLNSIANDGVLYNQKTHGRWVSGSYESNKGGYSARLYSQLTPKASLIINIYRDGDPTITLVNPLPKGIAKFAIGTSSVITCAVRVDSKKQYDTTCVIGITEQYVYTKLSSTVTSNILKDAKGGEFLRWKFDYDDDDPVYYSIDLSGFDEAYKRALSLKLDDADYFN